MKYRLRHLLITIAVVAVCLVALPRIWNFVNGNFDEVYAGLTGNPKIYDVEILENEQVEGIIFDVLAARFKIKGKPGASIAINTPNAAVFTDAEWIALDRIGDMVLETHHVSKSMGSSWGGVDVGPHSNLAAVLPFTVKNLDELIDRYDEFLSGIKQWPGPSKTGVVELSPTERIEYWAEPLSPNVVP
jgi:hypothetical protein